MKRSIYTLLLLTIISFATNAQKQTITMGFYNVENLFDTLDTPDKVDEEYLPTSAREWNSERYWTKIDHINKVIKALNTPILLGMCEVENKAVVQDIVDRGELKENYSVLHYESLDARGIDNALIYDKTILTLVDSGILRFDMPEGNTPSRDILWGKLLGSLGRVKS